MTSEATFVSVSQRLTDSAWTGGDEYDADANAGYYLSVLLDLALTNPVAVHEAMNRVNENLNRRAADIVARVTEGRYQKPVVDRRSWDGESNG